MFIKYILVYNNKMYNKLNDWSFGILLNPVMIQACKRVSVALSSYKLLVGHPEYLVEKKLPNTLMPSKKHKQLHSQMLKIMFNKHVIFITKFGLVTLKLITKVSAS